MEAREAVGVEVEEIAGPVADVRLVCDECGQARPGITEFACEYEDGEYGSQSVEFRLCADCLRKAADAIDKALAAETGREE